MEATQVNVMPRIGDKAPVFTAKTTQGVILKVSSTSQQTTRESGKSFSVTRQTLLRYVLRNS